MKQGSALYVPLNDLQSALRAQSGTHALRNRAVLMVSHYMGLRAMEIAALSIGDLFDPHTGKIKENIRLLSRMTKGGKYREVPFVNENAREALRLYLSGRNLRLDAPLFQSQQGGRFSANTMQRMIAICYQRANLPASSHSGRRSFATRLLQAGADIYTVQQLLGHASIMTTQRYLSASPERLKHFSGLLQ